MIISPSPIPGFSSAQIVEPPHWLPADSEIADYLKGKVGFQSFRIKLFKILGALLPAEGPLQLLDVGAGDGTMAGFFAKFRPETNCNGLETVVRHDESVAVPIQEYDGETLPFADKSFDGVLFSNVLHHTPHAARLVKEACRVARNFVLIKDHVYSSQLEWLKLLTLDYAGNMRFGVAVPAHYLNLKSWSEIFSSTPGTVSAAYKCQLRSGWARLLFPDSLEVIFVLRVNPNDSGSN